MSHTAFALTDELAGHVDPDADDPVPIFQGGVLALPPDGRSYDVAAQLDDGDGTIVVDTANSPLVELLRTYPALQEVAVPDGWRGQDDLDAWTVAMLRDEAERLEIARGGSKNDLVDRIQARRAELAGTPLDTPDEGDDAPDPDDDPEG